MLPKTWSRSLWMCSVKPASASPGFWMRELTIFAIGARFAREQLEAQVELLVGDQGGDADGVHAGQQ